MRAAGAGGEGRGHIDAAVTHLGLCGQEIRFLDELLGSERQCAFIAMKDGRIAFDGAPGELMRTATLRHVYDMEIPVRNYGGRRIGVFHLP